MRHIISILMHNEAGALVRVAGMFSQRGFNIESLNVAPTEDETVSRLTLVTTGTDAVLTQINRQLLKLVDVVDAADMTTGRHFERELLLVKIRAEGKQQEGVEGCIKRYGARMLDESESLHTLELTGTGPEVRDFMEELGSLSEIVEVVRTGAAAIAPGAQILQLED